ncbi:MAG: coenzyme F420-0:L-glutamate ligase [Acidobacteriales bacterium]|nr:coenzyme F420-0:L-glutamate ligase [Terriglobales bacterium]
MERFVEASHPGRAGMTVAGELRIIPVRVQGEVRRGNSILEKLLAGIESQGITLLAGDILVVTHKIVSKAEGAVVALSGTKPSASVRSWSKRYTLDPRVVQLALTQARRVVRRARGVLITETRHGFVCANSGVDVSNVDGGESAALLPRDPDRSAALLHRAIRKKLKISVPVIITDTFGRPWREGLTEVAVGVAGMQVFRDFRNQRDAQGYRLKATLEAVADELACAAGLVCGKLSGTPAAIIRGFEYSPGPGRARQLIRPPKRDLFR